MIYRQEIYQNQQAHEGIVSKGNKETQVKLTILNWQKVESGIMLSVVREAGMQEVSWRSRWVQQWHEAGKLRMHIYCDLEILLLRIYPKENFKHAYRMKYIKIFVASLFTMVGVGGSLGK